MFSGRIQGLSLTFNLCVVFVNTSGNNNTDMKVFSSHILLQAGHFHLPKNLHSFQFLLVYHPAYRNDDYNAILFA